MLQASATRAGGAEGDSTTAVRERAAALGFDVVGFARADEPLRDDFERYEAFVAGGMHGTMAYLADAREARRRLDTDAVLPGARSVVCVGKRYGRSDIDEAADPPLARRIARYARGQDYHNHLRKKLRRLAAFVRTLGPGVSARPLCDVEPVLERAWAARAGLGFVGKNGLIITPGQGSYQLLGEVVTTLELVPGEPMTERCGSCTRCLDACPTQAFVAPFVLDPRRCISYWTIETTDEPPEPLRAAIGEHLFGCDACQESCPFNRTAPPPPARVAAYRPLDRWSSTTLEDLVRLDDARWTRLAEGTPLHRAGPVGLARNAVLASTATAAAEEHRRVVAAGRAHPEAVVRRLAEWGAAVRDRSPSPVQGEIPGPQETRVPPGRRSD